MVPKNKFTKEEAAAAGSFDRDAVFGALVSKST